MTEPLRVEVVDGVGHIRLNRPERRNALDAEAGRRLLEVLDAWSVDPAVRAVLFTGEGGFFCSGGDIRAFHSVGREGVSRYLLGMATLLHNALARLARMDAPVVAGVQGGAAGAGLSLMLACDLVVAGESARFTLAYTRNGLSPDGGSTFYLAKVVGHRRALEMALTNRVLTAQEALEWGLVNRVVPDDAVEGEAWALARSLAQGPTRAYGQTRRLLLQGWGNALEAQMEDEAHAIARLGGTEDGWEGLSAFVEKRTPRFTGR